MPNILDPLIIESRSFRTIGMEGNDKLCLFCHYDQDSLIADYVVTYIAALHAAGCDICFVSNCEKIAESCLQKIAPLRRAG